MEIKKYTKDGITYTAHDLNNGLTVAAKHYRLSQWVDGYITEEELFSTLKNRGRPPGTMKVKHPETGEIVLLVDAAVEFGIDKYVLRSRFQRNGDHPVIWTKGRITDAIRESYGLPCNRGKNGSTKTSAADWGGLSNKSRNYKLKDIKVSDYEKKEHKKWERAPKGREFLEKLKTKGGFNDS